MIKLYDSGVYLVKGREIIEDKYDAKAALLHKVGKEVIKAQAIQGTIAYSILERHNTSGSMDKLKLRFDALASHDITYVGIIQTARASGLEKFPLPYVLTNCHNSLCAVGGTINEDDHMFALSAAKKYGGIYVPTHLAVIHQYMREMMSCCGSMILGSDSHTRYGALGTMAIGEGGGELAKQILNKTYDINRPEVVAVYLTGTPQKGVGPQDIALGIIGTVFKNGYVNNKIMEFVGDGIEGLSVEYRNGIDVMTTETTCLSSIWSTDEKVKDYFSAHGRAEAYAKLGPADIAYYDGLIYVDLGKIKPMIALPFHPSNTYTIEELNANPIDILNQVEKEAVRLLDNTNIKLDLAGKVRNGSIYVDQGIVAGCAGGTYDNIIDAADILAGRSTGNGVFSMSVYPSSQPTYISLVKNGSIEKLMNAGVIVRSAFCGPCFGAGDVPANKGLSIRHTTRNFPNREGSVPSNGQIASVALMDARSIAATAINGGRLTPATAIEVEYTKPQYHFSSEVYNKRVYNGFGKAGSDTALSLGPNIADWPDFPALPKHLLLKVVSFLTDPVTTTDELIPSGETSSYRSNPLKLAEFTLSRKDPAYVGKAKAVNKYEKVRQTGNNPVEEYKELEAVYQNISKIEGMAPVAPQEIGIGSTIYAVKPGDGSAREQAASSQKVLGGWANIAREYATKRYRSNLINWGMIPFILKEEPNFQNGDYIYIPNIREAVELQKTSIKAYVIGDQLQILKLTLGELSPDERQIIIKGCLINYYRDHND
ncbi:hydratase [Geosporobacter ferrireducens]|uniref:Hydratase n=1 Tax=Geosporobacter ferrireducens TaxID=1424294 RepID=A0A1D8GFB5_9FIRM|nr:hydratase [Geosporobacter ferrireducens]AOT69601.1 hydratase [Geosporobacter ferrireducens]MTI54701.1 hydratase [Geosporobacter ferrireducens]